MVVLILEDSKKDFVYLFRIKKLAEIHNFDVEFIIPAILNLQDGKCPYSTVSVIKRNNKLFFTTIFGYNTIKITILLLGT